MNKAGLVQMNTVIRQADGGFTTAGTHMCVNNNHHGNSTRTHTRSRHSQGDPWVRGPPYAPPPLGSPSRRADRVRPEGQRAGDISWRRAWRRAARRTRPPGVLDSPLDRENHVDPRGRYTGIRGGRLKVSGLAPSGGGLDGCTHHGSWGSMWSRGSWRSTDLQRSQGEVPLLMATTTKWDLR